MRGEHSLPAKYGRRGATLIEHSGTVHMDALLGGRQPLQISRRTRERIIALIEQDEAGAIEATAKQKAD